MQKVLPLTLAVLFCVLLYVLIFGHMSGYSVGMEFYHSAVVSKSISGNQRNRYIDQMGTWLTWIKHTSYVPQMRLNLRNKTTPESTTEKPKYVNGDSTKNPHSPPIGNPSGIEIPKDDSMKSIQTDHLGTRDDTKTRMVTKAQHMEETHGHSQNAKAGFEAGATHPEFMANITPIPIIHKKDFTKMPEWDFDDVYLRDDQQRQTTCAQSLRNSQDPEFKKSFIPNIQLFLHRDHMNMSEWNRLAHFNNPFGFMEYNYQEVKASLDLIRKPKTNQLLPVPTNEHQGCIRCAVVGTGGILNGSRMGKEIDSHHYVFRMNGAVIKGYEEDVGKKTSVYVHTAHSIVSSPYFFKKFGFDSIPHDEGIKYVMIPEGLRDFQWLQGLLQKEKVSNGPYKNVRPLGHYAGQFDENRFYVLHPDFLRYIRNRFMMSNQLKGKHWPLYRPTNGAFTLFLALHTCDIVDAYGFITAAHHKYPNYYFERFSKTRVIFYINHDYNLEIKTWKELHDTNIIRLYLREEDNRGTEQ